MNLLSSSPFWPIRDGLPENFPALERNVSCEVAVIGAGISGALCAFHLAEAGVDSVVLDRRDVAHGSTSGSTSLLQYEIDEPLHRLSRTYGRDHAVRSYRRCSEAIAAIERIVKRLQLECGFSRTKSLFLASSASAVPLLRREYASRREAGFDVTWWSRRDLSSRSSLPHPAAILSRDAAQIDAYRFTYDLLSAAVRSGSRVFDQTKVSRISFGAKGVVLHTGEGPTVRARHLIVATGYEANAHLPQILTDLQSTYALVTEPVDTFEGWPENRCLMWESAKRYAYLRTTEDRRIIIGGYDDPFVAPSSRDAALAAKRGLLTRRLRALLPAIPFTVAYAWAGTFARTKDGLPYIGRHPKVPHTFFALGYGGNGITYSLIAAEMIRDHVLKRPNADHELFGFDRKPSAGRG